MVLVQYIITKILFRNSILLCICCGLFKFFHSLYSMVGSLVCNSIIDFFGTFVVPSRCLFKMHKRFVMSPWQSCSLGLGYTRWKLLLLLALEFTCYSTWIHGQRVNMRERWVCFSLNICYPSHLFVAKMSESYFSFLHEFFLYHRLYF